MIGMKSILQSIAFCFLLLSAITDLIAQDARYSQYFNKPLNMNPALAGNGIEYIRVTAIYRSQWAGMGTPITTQGLSIDKVVNRVGIGATVSRNGAGDGSIKTLNLVGNLAYHLPLGYEQNHILSGGIQVGIVNKSFDPSKLTFDNQYNPDQGYDPMQNSGEIFATTSITRPDVNAGLFYQRGGMKKEIRFKPFAGVGFSHLTTPTETFIVEQSKVKIKRSVYAGAGITINDRTEIKPSVYNISQGAFNETTFGSMVNYQLDNKNLFQLGAYNRVNDAIIAYAGYQMNQLFVGMSYDINTGELSKTGKGTNAFEISLTYSPRPPKKKTPQPVKAETKPRKEIISPADKVTVQQVPNDISIEIAVKTVDQTVIPLPEKSTVSANEKNIVQKPTEVKPEIAISIPTRVNTETVVIPSIKHAEIKTKDPKNEVVQKPIVVTELSLPPSEDTETIVNPVTITVIPSAKPEITISEKAETAQNISLPEINESITTVAPVKVNEVAVPVSEKVMSHKTMSPAEMPVITEQETEIDEVIAEVPVITLPVDSDKDGIIDSEDQCPFIKGGKATNGCPDSDADGIIDMDDDCPLESGPLTNKGCPDPNIPEAKNSQEIVKSFDHILFATGSLKMTTDDIFDIIERAVDVLYANKNTTVLLSGHTDSEGNSAFNMTLSQSRIDVVKAYLLKQGIDESRIQSVAYGETMPVRDNLFEENMKQNRRVELSIIRIK